MKRYKESAVIDDEPESTPSDIFGQFEDEYNGFDDNGYDNNYDDPSAGFADPRGGQGRRGDGYSRLDEPQEGEILDKKGRKKAQKNAKKHAKNQAARERSENGRGGNIFGTIGMILGIVALICGIVALLLPVLAHAYLQPLSMVAATIGGIALILGIVGLISGIRNASGKGKPIVGMLLGILALVLGILTLLNPTMLAGSSSSSSNSTSNSNASNTSNDINVVDDGENGSESEENGEYDDEGVDGEYSGDDEDGEMDVSDDGDGTSDDEDDEVDTGDDEESTSASNTSNSATAAGSNYAPGNSEPTGYTNPYFGVTLTPNADYAIAQAGEIEEILQNEEFVSTADPSNAYGLGVEGAIINQTRDSWAAITVGQAQAFSDDATEDVNEIVQQRKEALDSEYDSSSTPASADTPTYTVTTGTVSIGGIILPSITVAETYPAGSSEPNIYSIEAYGANNGYIARYSTRAADEATATQLFGAFGLLQQ